MTENIEIDELFVHCGVLIGSLARKVKNKHVADELEEMSIRIAEISNAQTFNNEISQQKLGFYNDQKMDYGVQPRIDTTPAPWTIQTK